MKRFVVAAIALGVILTYSLRIRAQQNASAQIGREPVKQGSALKVTVSLDKAPNHVGSLSIDVAAADDDSSKFALGDRWPEGQKTGSVGGTVPFNAKLGKWVVKKISYQAYAAQKATDLTTSGDLSFQVIAHDEIVAPSAATVTEIK
jgi:hypothetical protein